MAITQGTPYSGAAPTTAYSGNPATGTFIPEIWSGKLIEKFYAATVLAAISNTDYEGEIRNMGDKVKIRTKPTITIRDYTLDQNLTVDRPSSTTVELTIDFAKYFNLVLDDIIERQSDMNMMSMWADDASEQMKIVIDQAVLAGISAGVAAKNKNSGAGIISGNINLGVSGTPIVPTPGPGAGYIVDLIVNMGQCLDEYNIPESGRWLIIPPWIGSMIKKSDLKNASISGDGVSLVRNGRLGMIDRFTLYSSNLLPVATDGTHVGSTHVFAGHTAGLTFASQISQMETLRSESTFGTLLRGLQVYGWKVLDGTCLVDLYVAPI
jgi:hypothetical protein